MIKEDFLIKDCRLKFLTLIFILLSYNFYAQTTMKKYINSEHAPDPVGPYNQGILIDGTLYTSGQIALDPKTMIMNNESIQTETKQVFKNIHEVLKEANFSFKDVIKVSIFLDDMEDFATVNEIYSTFFEKGKEPVRETIEVSGLPKKARIEVSVIAKK
jgi:2-iminobutanoate/2-iminopropanoate deaminase